MTPTIPLTGRRKLSAAELDIILAAHERFIAGRPGGKLAVLRFADLSGFDLTGRALSDADFSGSIFNGAKMARVCLERATLFGCDMQGVDLRRANLTRADMRGVCLWGADLSEADLTQADFRVGQIALPHPSKGLASPRHEQRAGQLDRANLAGATLDGSKLNEASAFAADFTDCSLRGAILSRANFKDANLAGAVLDGADIGGANLEGTDLTGACMSGVEIGRARVSGATNFTGVLTAPTQQAIAAAMAMIGQLKANHDWCKTGGRQGAPARLDGADLRPLGDSLRGMRLSAISAKGAMMLGMDLSGSHLQGANLQDADLRGASLRGADLRGARLAGANLTKADLRDAIFAPLPLGGDRVTLGSFDHASIRYALAQGSDMTKAVLDGADVRGCDFTGACLAGASLRGADMELSIGFGEALAA